MTSFWWPGRSGKNPVFSEAAKVPLLRPLKWQNWILLKKTRKKTCFFLENLKSVLVFSSEINFAPNHSVSDGDFFCNVFENHGFAKMKSFVFFAAFWEPAKIGKNPVRSAPL